MSWNAKKELTSKIPHYVDLIWAGTCPRLLSRWEVIVLALILGATSLFTIQFVQVHSDLIEEHKYEVAKRGGVLVRVTSDTPDADPMLKEQFLGLRREQRKQTLLIGGLLVLFGILFYKLRTNYYKSLLYGFDKKSIYIYANRWPFPKLRTYQILDIFDFKYKNGGLQIIERKLGQKKKTHYTIYTQDLSGLQEDLQRQRRDYYDEY